MNHRSIRRSTATAAATALALASLLGACGDDSDDTADTTTSVAATEPTSDTADTTAPVEDGMVISGMWARTSPAMATAGAVYLEISNNTGEDDALISASVDPSIAETVELHQTTMEPAADDSMTDSSEEPSMTEGSEMGGAGTDDTTGGDGTGMMKMAPVEEIPVPAGATAVLQPGGYHIMLLGLAAPLEVGSTIEVTLTFANAGEVVETADVLDTAP